MITRPYFSLFAKCCAYPVNCLVDTILQIAQHIIINMALWRTGEKHPSFITKYICSTDYLPSGTSYTVQHM